MICDDGKYYLYRYVRNDTKLPFYIGIGSKRKNRGYYNVISEFERAYSKTNRNSHFLNIINKIEYSIEILCQSNSLIYIKEKEKEFISLYGRIDKKTGVLVNLTDGGDGHFNMSDENKIKIGKLCSERFKGKKISIEQKNKFSKWQFGRKFSKESIKKRTETRKQNAIKRGYYVSIEKINKESKSVLQYDKEMNLIKIWDSISEPSRKLNIGKSGIINVCKLKPKYKTAGGFIWRYNFNKI